MTWYDAVRLAISSLHGSLIRTLLTVLGLGVGVAAVLTVLTLGDAGEVRVEDEIAKLGVDKVWIRSASGKRQLCLSDAAAVTQSTEAKVCAGAYTAANVVMEGTSVLTQVAGFDRAMGEVHAPKVLEGRSFLAQDFTQGSAVCLVDEALAERLGSQVIGKRLTLGGRRLCIVGVIKRMTMQTMTGGGGLLILPLSTYLGTFGGCVAELTLCVPRAQQAKQLAQQALDALADGHLLRADTLEKEINAAREVVRIFVMVLVCVAAVCMLTGGIGVMNVLLVSVRERRREIGLIKAIGGSSRQVGVLFLMEAVAYALCGGLLGLMLGAGMIAVFGGWIGLTARLEMAHALPVLLAAAILGAGFGVIPALKAAALPPVEALNCE